MNKTKKKQTHRYREQTSDDQWKVGIIGEIPSDPSHLRILLLPCSYQTRYVDPHQHPSCFLIRLHLLTPLTRAYLAHHPSDVSPLSFCQSLTPPKPLLPSLLLYWLTFITNLKHILTAAFMKVNNKSLLFTAIASFSLTSQFSLKSILSF